MQKVINVCILSTMALTAKAIFGYPWFIQQAYFT